MPIKLDVSTVSVIVSGCVAITGIAVPIIIGFIAENLKWKREKKSAETERIEIATKTLMNTLSDFLAQTYGMEDYSMQSRLLSCFYEWERAIWFYCGVDERDIVTKMRRDFEGKVPFYNKTNEYRNSISDQIHELTFNTIAKI